MAESHFDADLAWRYLKEKRYDFVEELIEDYKKDLELMERNDKHSMGKADVLAIYGYYKCIHLNEKKAGISFCNRAVERHPENPRNYLILGMAWLKMGFPNKALEILEAGYKVNPDYEPIHEGFREVNRRRPPVFSFLSRNNKLNIIMGKLRHRFQGPKLHDQKETPEKLS